MGVYGFAVEAPPAVREHLRDVPADWPALRIEQEQGTAAEPHPPGTVRGTDEHAVVWLGGGDRIEVDRPTMTVRIVAREPYSPDAVVHPLLGLPAAIAAHWLGRRTLHGGAFLAGGRAWALLGPREAGKSATLGALMRLGMEALSDDILVVEGTVLYAGPRSVDLRADPARVLGGDELRIPGNRDRWRLRPTGTLASAPLGGLVYLEWGPRTELVPMSAQARLDGLVTSSAVPPAPEEAVALLDLSALPTWRFTRPPDLDGLEAAASQLVEAVAG
jgi:hypothetical protein